MQYVLSAKEEDTLQMYVCKSKVFKNINARVSSSTLCVIHETPNCLTQASPTANTIDTEVSALIDSCSSMSFINKDTAKRLNIEINPCFDNVSTNIECSLITPRGE